MKKLTGYLLFLFVALSNFYCGTGLDQRQNPSALVQAKPNHHNNAKHSTISETCETVDNITRRVEVCAKPLTDILQGTLDKWPRTDNDIIDLCHMFQESERCIRDTSRKCAKGLQKVIISTFANSVQRVRKRECVKQRYSDLIRTTKCIEAHQEVPQFLIANATTRLNVVEDQMKDPDQKTRAICCMVNDIESEIKRLMGLFCPAEVKTIIKLYRSVLEDVIQILCRSAKCEDLFIGYKMPKIKVKADFQGIISSLLKIVFSLSE